METKMNWLKWPLDHYQISLLIIGILFVLGIYGMYVMPKDEFPHATIRQGVVVAVYPGATSEEVEEQVAKPLERYLFTFGEVNRVKTTSQSQNGMYVFNFVLNVKHCSFCSPNSFTFATDGMRRNRSLRSSLYCLSSR